MKAAARKAAFGALFGLWMLSACMAGAVLIAISYLEDAV